MYRLGLIGKNLEYSQSKEVYERILKAPFEYHYLEFDSTELLTDLNGLLAGYTGLSVTSPYKRYVYSLVQTDSRLDSLKSVNCLKFDKEVVTGINTDYTASQEILKKYKCILKGSILILGNGSMSQVVAQACKDNELEFDVSSRKTDEFNLFLSKSQDYELIINSCAREFDFSTIQFSKSQYLWDLNYNQSYSVRIKIKYGDYYSDGLELLLKQAQHACKYWEIK